MPSFSTHGLLLFWRVDACTVTFLQRSTFRQGSRQELPVYVAEGPFSWHARNGMAVSVRFFLTGTGRESLLSLQISFSALGRQTSHQAAVFHNGHEGTVGHIQITADESSLASNIITVVIILGGASCRITSSFFAFVYCRCNSVLVKLDFVCCCCRVPLHMQPKHLFFSPSVYVCVLRVIFVQNILL